SLGAIAALAEGEELSEIVCRAGSKELLKHWKVSLLLADFDTSTHRRIVLTAIRATDEITKRAVLPARCRLSVVGELLGLDRIEIASPRVAIATPLRMQSLHCCVPAPERHAVNDKALAKAIEKIVGRGAAKPFAHCPDMQLDDASS